MVQTRASVEGEQGSRSSRNERCGSEQTVNEGLAADIADQLGGDYLVDIKFTLNKVVPPAEISEAINKAQAAFAGVTQAQGRLRAAEIDAKANQARQKGYEGCPACAAIDQLKAIPENVKTFRPPPARTSRSRHRILAAAVILC